MERKQEEQERRLSALERMHNCTDHLRYHREMDLRQMEYWLDEGIDADSIAKYQLGFCPRCPTDREGRSSYTIPVYDRDGDTLINIRHRLLTSDKGDKYRPHTAGLGAQLFNAAFTTQKKSGIIVTEGEKKSIVLDQYGLSSVAIMGKRSFKTEWLEWLKPFSTVYVALDPDARDSAERLAGLFDGRGMVVDLPCKVDDMLVKHGATPDDIRWFMSMARPIEGKRE
jgi:DNA primase